MKTNFQNKPGPFETRLSAIILVLLAIVAGGIYLRQSHINPAVIALRPDAQPSASPLKTILPDGVSSAGSDIIPFSPPETFGPDTLYEKINGRADLYLASGFVSLNAQRFTLKGAAGSWIEMLVYDMHTPENAFSVYSMQRREGATTDSRLPNAYRTENALFMVHGQFYLELIGTRGDEALHGAMQTLARLFSPSQDGASTATAPGAALFPAQGLDPATRQLITANAFGYEMLDHIYSAEYVLDGARLTAFISERQDPAAASALTGNYRQKLVSYGAVIVDTPSSVAGATALKFFDTYEIVFSRGRYLAGVHEADDLKTAESLAYRLAEHLERLADK